MTINAFFDGQMLGSGRKTTVFSKKPSTRSPSELPGIYGSTSTTDEIFRFNELDGSVEWTNSIGFAGFSSYPDVDRNGNLYFCSGDVFKIDPSDGSVIDSFDADGNTANAPPLVKDGVVFFGTNEGFFSTGTIQAYDFNNNNQRWSTTVDERIDTSACVVDRYLYQPLSNNIASYDTVDGSEEWKVSTTPETAASFLDGLIYLGASSGGGAGALSTDGGVQAYTPGGSLKYSSNDYVAVNGLAVEEVVEGSVYNVYITTDKSGAEITGLNKNLTEAWTFGTGVNVTSRPAVYDGNVYAADADGTVYSVVATGELGGSENWSTSIPPVGTPRIAVKNDLVYVGTRNNQNNDVGGLLYGLDLSGNIIFSSPDVGAELSGMSLARDSQFSYNDRTGRNPILLE